MSDRRTTADGRIIPNILSVELKYEADGESRIRTVWRRSDESIEAFLQRASELVLTLAVERTGDK